MWLMYPVTAAEVREARQGVAALLAASAVWYLALVGVVAARAGDVLFRVRAKFEQVPEDEYYALAARKGWFYALVLALAVSAVLRFVGYVRLRSVAGAVGQGQAQQLAVLGVAVTLATPVGVPVSGIGGMLALIMAAGTALELQLLRAPAALFGLTVSAAAARRVTLLRHAWLGWLVLVAVAAIVLQVGQGFNALERSPGTPTDRMALGATAALRAVFGGLAGLALVTAPVLAAGYWWTLLGVYATAPRLADPRGATAAPPRDDPRPLDRLKELLQNPYA